MQMLVPKGVTIDPAEMREFLGYTMKMCSWALMFAGTSMNQEFRERREFTYSNFLSWRAEVAKNRLWWQKTRGLSNRADLTLRRLGVESELELDALTDREILAVKDCGPKTLAELRAWSSKLKTRKAAWTSPQ